MRRHAVCGAVAFVLFSSPLWAQTRPRPGPGQGSGGRGNLAQARDAVQSAQQSLDDAERALAQAEQDFRQAARQVRESENAFRRQHRESAEVVRAREARDAARAGFEEVREPVLARLRETSAYQAAVGDADAARQRIETLRSDMQLGDEERAARTRTQQALVARVMNLEQEALQADPGAQAARQKLKEAEQELLRLTAERNKALQEDPGVRQARGRVDAARLAREEARADIEDARRQLARAAEQLAAATVAERARQAQRVPRLRARGIRPRGL